MTNLGHLEELKFPVCKTGMTVQMHDWKVLMVTFTRSRTKFVFEGIIDKALVDNTAVIVNGDQPLLTPQE